LGYWLVSCDSNKVAATLEVFEARNHIWVEILAQETIVDLRTESGHNSLPADVRPDNIKEFSVIPPLGNQASQHTKHRHAGNGQPVSQERPGSGLVNQRLPYIEEYCSDSQIDGPPTEVQRLSEFSSTENCDSARTASVFSFVVCAAPFRRHSNRFHKAFWGSG
jgi:hypothetical protein